jgi:tRNA(Ile)-lysidine synthetase-like protein
MELIQSVATLAPAPYAVAVSGGADSVALLHALHHHRPDLPLHVAHLDHQLRGAASDEDAAFVKSLCVRWDIPATILRRSDIELGIKGLPANPSARYRALRHELFRRVVVANALSGVLLAHHADDQAETIFHRLLRRSSPAGLGGMAARVELAGTVLLRPLLGVTRAQIRAYLDQHHQPWREDASNQSEDYLRNRIRRVLTRHEPLRSPLLEVGISMERLQAWVMSHAPRLAERFWSDNVATMPLLLAQQALRQWLRDRGCPAEEITPDVVQRLLILITDAASPPRQDFPGPITIHRKRGWISAGEKPRE